MREPGWWLEGKRDKFRGCDEDVVKFWMEFVEALADIVSDDGCVDFNDPECIAAYVGPPYASIRLQAQDKTIDIACDDSAHPPRLLYHKTLRIADGLGDMSEWGVIGPRTAVECGNFIAKGMFELRKGPVCS